MEQTIVDSLKNLQLTKEEEEDIFISSNSSPDLLEECALSLFGKLLVDRNQNQRALKNTLRSTWKMGSDLRIVEVGNNVLQFKFSSMFQLEWVERSGPWNFENNLLLLCRWRKGLSSANVVFTHAPFWIQIWGLPFEYMTEEAGRDIGSKIGRVIEVDKRSWQADHAKFMRVRIDLPIEKPLRRGGYVTNMDVDRCWVSFKYERLPTFCFSCGKIGHDEKHCGMLLEKQPIEKQYGDWLRAGSSSKGLNEGSRGSGSSSYETKNDGSRGSGSRSHEPTKNKEAGKMSQATVGEVAVSVQSRNERSSSLGGKVSLEGREKFEFLEKKRHETRTEIGAASYQKGWDTLGAEMQVKSKGKEPCNTQKLTTNQPDKDLSNSNVDESSKVGHAVKPNLKEQEAICPLKPKTNIRVQEASDSLKPKLIKTNIEEKLVLAGLIKGKSGMGRAKLKKVAREVGKAQGAGMKPLEITVGIKRREDTERLAECEGRPQKRSCNEEGKNNASLCDNFIEETAVAARQHRREQ